MSHTRISAEQFKQQLEPGTDTLVDVRSPAEFNGCHLSQAINLPLDQLSPDQLPGQPNGRVYLICQAGKRAAMAAEKLESAYAGELVVVEGGTEACTGLGMSAYYGKAHMSLERQVRIVAGSLVVLGVILSLTVDIGFIALSGLVGAGLIFAGISDTCAMGKLLMKMPWNKN